MQISHDKLCQEAHRRRHFHRFAKVSRIHEHLKFDPFQQACVSSSISLHACV